MQQVYNINLYLLNIFYIITILHIFIKNKNYEKNIYFSDRYHTFIG